MQEANSSRIIPFPKRPQTPHTRLKAALEKLDAALEEQRAALSGWRDSLDTLGASIHRLGGTMRTYDTALGDVRRRVAVLGDQARKLETAMGPFAG